MSFDNVYLFMSVPISLVLNFLTPWLGVCFQIGAVFVYWRMEPNGELQ